MNALDTRCRFESLNEPECDAEATVEFTVAHIEESTGSPETPYTYRVCARHRAAVVADIADTQWEMRDEHSLAG